MKISELLELTQSEPLNKIAKERLTIGEKPTREALKKAGCYNVSGKRGWHFDGAEDVLEQSIYDFAPAKKINRTTRPKANVLTVTTKEQKERKKETTKGTNEQTNEPTNERTNVDTKRSKEEIKQANEQVAPTLEPIGQTNEKTIVRKRSSFDLDVELLKELKIKAIIHDKNVYEIVETAIRKHLKGL